MKGAVLHDFRKEAKHTRHSCDLEASAALITGHLLGADLSKALALPVSEFPLSLVL